MRKSGAQAHYHRQRRRHAKKIATYARQDLENITGYKVFLTVFVKVRENWREKEYIIKELGYDEKKIKNNPHIISGLVTC